MKFEKKSEFFWKVKTSDALRSLKSTVEKGETVKFIVTKEGDIILGTGLHEGVANENGLVYDDIEVAGQFSWKEGKIKWGYPDVRERKTVVEEKIEEFLKTKGINI
jgi:hypothetical protein